MTIFSLMLRSVLLLCSSRPVWAVRSMFGTNLQHELSLNPLWYGTKAFEKQYDNQASCFCKQVESISECPSRKGEEVNKHGNPLGFRWFHANENSGPESLKPHLCCKLAMSKSWVFVGWKYQRQEDLHLCMSEVRPIQPEVCCRLQDDVGAINFHIRRARSEGYMAAYSHPPGVYFGRSRPIIHMEDIAYGVDYDGSRVSMADVQDFVRKNFAGIYDGKESSKPWDSRYNFTCSESLETLLEDKSDCRLRSKPASQCCCHQAAIKPEERCFPVDTNSSSGPIIVNGTYSEHKQWVHGHSFKKGRIDWPTGSNPNILEENPPSLTSSYKDQEGNELTFHWKLSSKQWTSFCVDYVRFAEPKQYRWGTMWNNRKWQKFRQHYGQRCISFKYTRDCPSGEALFWKKRDLGKCLAEPSQTEEGELHLKALSQYSFKCPDNYVASTDSYRCKCKTTC